MKKLLLMVAIAFSIVSCTDDSTQTTFRTRRIVVLENNSVSFINIPSHLDSVYRTNDTVWVNLFTHRIDDLDSSAMMSVIKP